jgi:hypothetical protein
MTPALIIYLLDISRSMNQISGGRRRIETVLEAMDRVIEMMLIRCGGEEDPPPRYRIAMFGYHSKAIDLLGGVKTIDVLVKEDFHGGIPEPKLDFGTQTAKGFERVEELLQLELPNLRDCPAPLVCHLTDGLYGGPDPEPVVDRIRKMSVPDGNVLVENIFLTKRVLRTPVADPKTWPGVTSVEQLGKPYARKLFAMSSPIPDSYLETIRDFGFAIQPGAKLLFPGSNPGLVELGFVISHMTKIG